MSSLDRACTLLTVSSISVPMTKAVMSSAYKCTSPTATGSDVVHEYGQYSGVPSGYARYSVNTLGYQKKYFFEKAYSLEARDSIQPFIIV